MKNNKGFTIVELVIVIAVIAILASVLVPTFSGIVLKAQRNADTQVVRMLNEDVAIDLATSDKDKHDTMYDAVKACIDLGLSPDKIAAKSDYKIAWESTTGRFVLIDPVESKVMYPQNNNFLSEYNFTGNERDYFVVTTFDESIEKGTFKYSAYAYGNDWPSELTISTGFDAGDIEGFDKITYKNNNEKQNVLVRTNSFETKLVIDGNIEDNIRHYGYSGLVNITQIGKDSYEEYGVIGHLNVEYGHVNLKENAIVYQLEAADNENTIVSKDVKAVLYDVNGNKIEGSIEESKTMFSSAEEKLTGETCTHDNGSQIVINNGVYEVCKKCGFTLITVKRERSKKAVYTASNENVIILASTYNQKAIDSIVSNKAVLKDKAKPVSLYATESNESKTGVNCDHEWAEQVVTKEFTELQDGSAKISCKLCDADYSIVLKSTHEHVVDAVTDKCKLCNEEVVDFWECDHKEYTSDETETGWKLISNNKYRCSVCYCEKDTSIDFTETTVWKFNDKLDLGTADSWFSVHISGACSPANNYFYLPYDIDVSMRLYIYISPAAFLFDIGGDETSISGIDNRPVYADGTWKTYKNQNEVETVKVFTLGGFPTAPTNGSDEEKLCIWLQNNATKKDEVTMTFKKSSLSNKDYGSFSITAPAGSSFADLVGLKTSNGDTISKVDITGWSKYKKNYPNAIKVELNGTTTVYLCYNSNDFTAPFVEDMLVKDYIGTYCDNIPTK